MAQMTAFSLLGLPEKFAITADEVEAAWKKAIALVHPDRFAGRPAAERRVAEQWAGRINEARDVLASDVGRATELLKLRGVDIRTETDTRMDSAFLMQQMDWRERLENADEAGRAALASDVAAAKDAEKAVLTNALDESFDAEKARSAMRRLMFIEKMAAAVAGLRETL